MGNLTSTPTWELSHWDKAGYNPKNGKCMSLFRWEGNVFGEIFHKTTGQICPVLSLSRPHARAFQFAWFNFFICFIMWFAIGIIMPLHCDTKTPVAGVHYPRAGKRKS